MRKLKTTKLRMMNTIEDNEFQGIGKNTPYKVPDDFFETVSEKILLKAKEREHNHGKSRVLWRTVAVAASMAAMLLLGYFIFEPDNKPVTNLIVQNVQPVEQQIIQKQEINKQPEVAEVKPAEPEKIISKENSTEVVSDVLTDLSDEELLQLAAMIKADPFINESAQ